jgi:hypothetical protein
MWSPIRDIRLIKILDSNRNIIDYRLEFRRVGAHGDWEVAPVIEEKGINDREDNTITSDIQRSVREKGASFPQG